MGDATAGFVCPNLAVCVRTSAIPLFCFNVCLEYSRKIVRRESKLPDVCIHDQTETLGSNYLGSDRNAE